MLLIYEPIQFFMRLGIIIFKEATSAKRLEKENPLFLDLSEGTRYVLNAPGKDWNLDLSIPNVRIC